MQPKISTQHQQQILRDKKIYQLLCLCLIWIFNKSFSQSLEILYGMESKLQLVNQRTRHMQRSGTLDKIEIYNTLYQHYMLLYIHDIQEFNLEDVQNLANKLDAKLQLNQEQEQIHQQLISMSMQNVQIKKMEKKNKNRIKKNKRMTSRFFNLNPQKQPITDLFQREELQTIEQSVIYPSDTQSKSWTQLGKFIGTILFEGNLMISLPIKHKGKLFKNVPFEVKGSQQRSCITPATLRKLKVDQSLNQITLEVAQRKHLFLTNGKSNTLGLDFLKSHRAILQCYYRQEINKFTLTFTT